MAVMTVQGCEQCKIHLPLAMKEASFMRSCRYMVPCDSWPFEQLSLNLDEQCLSQVAYAELSDHQKWVGCAFQLSELPLRALSPGSSSRSSQTSGKFTRFTQPCNSCKSRTRTSAKPRPCEARCQANDDDRCASFVAFRKPGSHIAILLSSTKTFTSVAEYSQLNSPSCYSNNCLPNLIAPLIATPTTRRNT